MKNIVFIIFALLVPIASYAQPTTMTPEMVQASSPPAAASQNKVAVVQVASPSEPTTSATIGTWLGDLIAAMAAIFGPVIATFLTKWVIAVAKKAGVEASQAMADRLDQIITNGLHIGASEAQRDLTGKLNVEVKNKIIATAVAYAQTNGSKLIAGMANPATTEELQARAAKVLSAIGPDAVLAMAPPVKIEPAKEGIKA